jgi:hypothetical protein
VGNVIKIMRTIKINNDIEGVSVEKKKDYYSIEMGFPPFLQFSLRELATIEASFPTRVGEVLINGYKDRTVLECRVWRSDVKFKHEVKLITLITRTYEEEVEKVEHPNKRRREP